MDPYQEITESQRNWSPPRELATSTPRQVELSGKGIGLTILATLLIGAGLVGGTMIAIVSGGQSRDIALVKREGQDAEARVIALLRNANQKKLPRLTYEFDWNGQIYARSTDIPVSEWEALRGRTTVAIRFLAADPSHNYLRDYDEAGLPMFLAPFIAVMFGGGGVVILFMIRRERFLLEEGRPALGIVIKHSFAQHGQKAMIYNFPGLDGAMVKGRSRPMRKPGAVGSSVCVLYDRERPRRNTAYPTLFVRLVK